MRLGLLGGTFDPIHMGHLVIAEEARVAFQLEEVVFIPAGQPWLKQERSVSPAELRLQMTRLAVSSNPFFRVSAVELGRPGPTYTTDTLAALREEWGTEGEMYFLMGMDALAELPRWKDPARFLELCIPVVFERPNWSPAALAEVEAHLPGLKERVRVVQGPAMDISSTDIRRRVAEGVSIRYLVPAKVERFIVEHGLYRSQEARSVRAMSGGAP